MAKKNIAPPGPAKVSQLPLPISDSPLVIDLPDGQKLVIGKMAEGSVIEVATWRGTGRPDSRTSRLMLGMSQGKLSDEDQSDEKSSRPAKKPEGFQKYLAIVGRTLGFLLSQAKKVKVPKSFPLPFKGAKGGKKSFSTTPKPLDRPLTETPSRVDSNPSPIKTIAKGEESIDEWLDQIMKKSQASGKRAASGSAKPSVKKPAQAKPIVKKSTSVAKTISTSKKSR